MAPIYLPGGSEVSEIILPDGTTAREVIAPDGTTVFSVIPDSVVNRSPFDEGSGESFDDTVGGTSGTLDSTVTWDSNTVFKGDTAPYFDGSNSGSWSPRSQTPITVTCRVRAASSFEGPRNDNDFFGFGNFPAGVYNDDDNQWRAVTSSGNEIIGVSESLSNVTDAVRIIAIRLDSSTLAIDVYQADASAKVGSNSTSNPTTTIDSSTMYVGDNGNSRYWTGNVDLIDVHNKFVSDIDSVVAGVYG